jgi:hypothetical protein
MFSTSGTVCIGMRDIDKRKQRDKGEGSRREAQEPDKWCAEEGMSGQYGGAVWLVELAEGGRWALAFAYWRRC